MAQHRILTPNRTWPWLGRDPLDRQHALFSIVAHIDALGLGSWTQSLLAWLSRFDGLEPHIEAEHDPLSCARQVLCGFVLSGRHASDADGSHLKSDIANELVAAPFVSYIAYWVKPHETPHAKHLRMWNPLQQPWLSYVEDIAGLGMSEQELEAALLRVIQGANTDRKAHCLHIYGHSR